MTKNWEREKARMHELYMVRGMKLAHLQKIMNEQYGFQASERAYKQKFKEWRWFKKTPRSTTSAATSPREREVSNSPTESDPYGSDHAASRTGSPYQPQYAHGVAAARHRDVSGAYEQPTYEPYPVTMGYDAAYPNGPPVTSDSIGHLGNYGMMAASQIPAMTLGPMVQPGRAEYAVTSPQVSLPPMSHLQQGAFKDALREAERRAEMGHYDLAEQALQGAMKSLQWMKNSQ